MSSHPEDSASSLMNPSGQPSISKRTCKWSVADSLAMLVSHGDQSFDPSSNAAISSFDTVEDVDLPVIASVTFRATQTFSSLPPPSNLVLLHQQFLF
jgi:hypothetical protein